MDYGERADTQRQLLDYDGIPASEDRNEPSNHNDSAQEDYELKDIARYPDVGATTQMWNSTWLHPAVLITFAALFAALFIATILLYHFSELHHGLSSQVSANHYSWTYGPTARELLSI